MHLYTHSFKLTITFIGLTKYPSNNNIAEYKFYSIHLG